MLTYGAYRMVPGAFVPDEDQGYFITVIQGPEGVSLDYTEKVLVKAEEILKQRPETKNVFAVGGFSFSGATPNNGIIFTTLKPWDQRRGEEHSVKGIIGGFFPKPSGLFPQLVSIKEATVIPFPPPPIQGLGNFGGFEFHLQDQTGFGFGTIGEVLGKFWAKQVLTPPQRIPS